MLPTGDTTTAVPVQNTSSASSNSSTVTRRSSTCKFRWPLRNRTNSRIYYLLQLVSTNDKLPMQLSRIITDIHVVSWTRDKQTISEYQISFSLTPTRWLQANAVQWWTVRGKGERRINQMKEKKKRNSKHTRNIKKTYKVSQM